jgi:hypothetical protein
VPDACFPSWCMLQNQIKQNWALAERAEANQKPVPPEAVKPKDKVRERTNPFGLPPRPPLRTVAKGSGRRL